MNLPSIVPVLTGMLFCCQGCETLRPATDVTPQPKGAQRLEGVSNVPAWALLREGMTLEEASALIGEPLRGLPQAPDPIATSAALVYGTLSFDHAAFPEPLAFRLIVGLDDQVIRSVDQPFSTPLANDELAPPNLLTPEQDAEMHHYPRLADFRWKPCFAPEPVEYEFELWLLQSPAPTGFATRYLMPPGARLESTAACEVPFHAAALPGKNEYLWRVRAKTESKSGPWSEARKLTSHR